MAVFLGIDTSNYSTSLSLFNSKNNSEKSVRKLLPVKDGTLGLRQSDAVFHHTKQIPELMDDFFNGEDISAVGVSVFPRRQKGSYMPCFLVGKSVATAISKTHNIPLYEFSHQEGHIVSALYSAGKLDLLKEKFIAFHLSGGTTEALLVSPDEENVINCEIISETSDLNAGQIVDRVGKMLGLSFPSGPDLEKLANENTQDIKPIAKLYDGKISFSGLENKCNKLLLDGKSKEYIADFAIKHIEKTLELLIENLIEKYGKLPLLFAGGVMSNLYIQNKIKEKYDGFFATPKFSSDNALGVAILASLKNGGKV
jgi:N6-L-threonylcarbamoyladenine synthase